MGDFFGKDTPTAPANDKLSALAERLYTETDPLRLSLINRSTNFIDNGMNPMASPLYEPIRAATNTAYNKAKQNVIANTPEGGALTGALTDLEASRANQLTQGAGQILSDEMARAMGLGTGMTSTALGGLGTAGMTQANLALAQSEQNAGAKQGLGYGVGAYLGGPAFAAK